MHCCVLFCVTGTRQEFFEKGFLKALHSVRRTNPHLPVVVFFDHLSTDQRRRLDGCDLRQVDATPFQAEHRDDLTSATFFRFYLGRELGDVDRVLYLDGDIVVLDNLDSVLDTGEPLAAYANPALSPAGEFSDSVDLAARQGLTAWRPMFNAGVVCFDGPYWKKAGLLERSLELVNTYGWEMFRNCDQGILNLLANMTDGYCELHQRFNFWPHAAPRAGLLRNRRGLLAPEVDGAPASVVHWAGPKKPWQRRSTWMHRLFPRLHRVTADACYFQKF